MIGKSDFIGDGGFGAKPVIVDLEKTTGFHNLYLVFTNREAKGGGALMIIMNTVFRSDDSTQPEEKAEPLKAVDLNSYTGTYKMTGLPFEEVTVSVKDGKLVMDAGGQTGELKPMASEDTFDADGRATIIFTRSEDKKVTGLKLQAMGAGFDGEKK